MNEHVLKKLRNAFYCALAAFLLLFCACGGFFTSKRMTVHADSAQSAQTPQVGSYACILYEDTFFYASADENSGLFLLPATYYVKLINYGKAYCHVEYLYDDTEVRKLVGYVKTDRLTFVDYIPNRPYFYHVFELHYRIDETPLDNSDFLNEITLTCAYYGDYKVGSKTYCYVLRGENFGYVPKPTTLTVEPNHEYEEYLAQQTNSSTADSAVTQPTSSPAQIAILIALCLLVPVLAALILKPPRRPPYDLDNE